MEQPNILIVDDESDHRFLLAAALQEVLPGHRATLAASAEEALAEVACQEFDVVLCDYCLGAEDGLDFLRALRERGNDVPVLLVTNHGNEEVARRAFLEGVVDYLTKDAALQHPADLQRRLRRALERRRLEKEKHKAESILESFLENNPYAILIFNAQGRVIRWNRALARLESHPEDLLHLRHAYNPLADPQLAEAGVTPLLEQALAGRWVELAPFDWDPEKAGFRGPARVLRGVAFPIAIEGEKTPHLCAMFQDVTEAEAARRERNEYAAILAHLLQATDAAIFFVVPDQTVRFANRRLGEFFGIDPQSAVGLSFDALADVLAGRAADPAAVRVRLAALQANPAEESEAALDLVRPVRRHLRCHSSPVRDGGGNLLGRMVTYFDETEAVEKRRLLEAQNRELDAFASRLAHDLKTPLVSLKGFVDLLVRQYGHVFDERAGLFLDKVRSSATLLGEMVDGLRELAHASDDAPCTASLDPLPVVRLIVDGLAAEAAERNVELELPADMPGVRCDRTKLYQIIQNLLLNAVRHSDPAKPRRWARLRATRKGDEVAIEVSDNGVGIDPGELQELFRPFRRGRQAAGRPGMGLGLAIVERMAQVCGGRVEVQSRCGEGSTFTVHLPAAD